MLAPDFNLPDQNGQIHRLSDYRGRWVVLYFYPKDDTPGCTKEACGFRDSLSDLTARGVAVLGVSKDSVASHLRFSQKYHLNFPLLSDPSTKVIQTYGAWVGKTLRRTFLIDPTGQTRKVYEKVDPTYHSSQILQDLDALNK